MIGSTVLRFLAAASVLFACGCSKPPEWPPRPAAESSEEALALAADTEIDYELRGLDVQERAAGGLNRFGSHLYNVNALEVRGSLTSKIGSVEKAAEFARADFVFRDSDFKQSRCADPTRCGGGEWALCLSSGALLIDTEHLLGEAKKLKFEQGGAPEEFYMRNEFAFRALTDKVGIIEIDPGRKHQLCMPVAANGSPVLVIAPLGTRLLTAGKQIERRSDGWYYDGTKLGPT